MKKSILSLILVTVFLFFAKSQASAQCTLQIGSDCCGCGNAKPQFVNICAGGSWYGTCLPTSNSACACACTKNCSGDQCGQSDGCGGSCGSADSGTCGKCGNGACCSRNCNGDQCGQSDGCGGSCGSGDKGSCGKCGNNPCCTPVCNGYQCGQFDSCYSVCGNTDALTGCSPACGQNSVCGNACGTASEGVPGAVTVTSPVNGSEVVRSGTQVTISWTAVAVATKYDLEVLPKDNPTCADARAICSLASNGQGIVGTSYAFTPQANRYVYTLRAVNAICSAQNGTFYYGPWTSSVSFNVVADITGTVYADPTAQAQVSGALCTLAGSPAGTQAGAGSTVKVTDASGVRAQVAVGGTGVYTAPSLYNGLSTVAFTQGDSSYACSCPIGCTYGGVIPPTANVNFYVSQIGKNWFQAMGGDLNASSQNTAFLDPITSLCVAPGCQPYPLLPVPGGTPSQQGALITPNNINNVDISDQAGFQGTPVGPVGSSYAVKNSASLACKENYDYFYRLYSLGTAPKEDFVGPENSPNHAHLPDLASLNVDSTGATKGAYFHSGDLTIDTNWTLSGSQSFIIFVKGNLNVTNNAHLTMPVGTYLAFFVSGSITFDSTIGSIDPSSTAGVVQGVFVANGNITVQSVGANPVTNEKKFIGEGAFAACGNISLPRDYRNSPSVLYGLNNNKYPASLFIFRPDVVTGAPDKEKQPIMNWQEIAP